ncbi:MAG: Xaa-Pro aminopeptidase [Acidobacteria bacterium]|nr:Xaa-Pro aminopeptidase [Acidobacteriota bacterium]
MFDADTYVRRRNRLKASLDSGLALFLGNDEAPFNYRDNHYQFRQDSTFLYFWGLNAANLAATLDFDSGEEILYGYEPTLDDIVWTGPLPTLSEWGEKIGVVDCRNIDRLREDVQAALAAGREVHVLPAYRGDTALKLSGLLDVAPIDLPSRESEQLVREIIALRSPKEAQEIAEIEKALEVSYHTHTAAMRATRPGLYEWEVVRQVEACHARHGSPVSFPIIFSVRGEVLHNHGHDNRMLEGQMVVHDSGATSPEEYASDITRSFPVSGRFDTRQREIYQIVLQALADATAEVRPGMPFIDVYKTAARTQMDGLKQLGLVRGDTHEAVEQGAHAAFLQCGTGHMLGLDVHDMEGLGEELVGYDDTVQRSPLFGACYVRLGRALEPDWVVAVEPGIYFIPELIDRWSAEAKYSEFIDWPAVDKYRDFGGIRIEDDVQVTADGHRVLGRPIPKTVDDVEETMASEDDGDS